MTSARAVLAQAVDAFNSRNEKAFLALGAADVDLPSPGGLNFHGAEGWRAWYRLWDDACPDHRVRYHNIVGDGEQAIGEGVFTGTQTGVLHLPTGDVPPSGLARSCGPTRRASSSPTSPARTTPTGCSTRTRPGRAACSCRRCGCPDGRRR